MMLYNNYVDKVHKILLVSTLFEIKTIQPSKARKQNKVAIDINIIQVFLSLRCADLKLAFTYVWCCAEIIIYN